MQLTELEYLMPDGGMSVLPVASDPHEPTFHDLLRQIALGWEHLFENEWPVMEMVLVRAQVTRAEHTPGRLPTVYEYNPQWNRWDRREGDN